MIYLNFLKKNHIKISYLIIGILIVCLFRCGNTAQLAKAEYKSVKEKNAILEDISKDAKKEIDNLLKVNLELEKDKQIQNVIISDLRHDLDSVMQRGQKIKKVYQNADNKAWAGYIIEKYKILPSYTDTYLQMPTKLTSLVGNDLIAGDVAKAELKIYKGILNETETKVEILETQIGVKDEIIEQNQIITDALSEQKQGLETLAENQLKIIKRESKKFSVGVMVGYGINFGETVRTAPFLGIGVSRQIFKF